MAWPRKMAGIRQITQGARRWRQPIAAITLPVPASSASWLRQMGASPDSN